MAVTQKSLSLARDLNDALTIRMGQLSTPLAVAQSSDTDEFPLITIGTGVASTEGCLIKVNTVEWANAQDHLGNSAIHYGGHRIQIVLEANDAGAAEADINSWDFLLPMLAECISKGTVVEVYERAHGTFPSASDITGAPTAVYGDLVNGQMIAS